MSIDVMVISENATLQRMWEHRVHKSANDLGTDAETPETRMFLTINRKIKDSLLMSESLCLKIDSQVAIQDSEKRVLASPP